MLRNNDYSIVYDAVLLDQACSKLKQALCNRAAVARYEERHNNAEQLWNDALRLRIVSRRHVTRK